MSRIDPQLPTFFVIGAAKCGTTSLHGYLNAHPDVSMTREKEPQIFAGDDHRDRLHRYDSLFEPGKSVRGESSAVYSQFPRWRSVPERMHASLPDARFVYLVGDPITRIVAHYAQHRSDLKESRPLEVALRDFESPESIYVCPSRYATQVRRYLDWFPPDRLLVVDQEDLRSRRNETMAEVFAFLEVDPGRGVSGFEYQLNTRREHREHTALGHRLEQSRVMHAARALPVGGSPRRALRRLVWRQLERPALDERLRGELASSLRSEVDWLRDFSGRAFPSWSI